MPYTRSIYGPGIGGDALAESLVATSGHLAYSIRFRAAATSNLVSVRLPYFGPDEPGYGGGTGGTWSLSVFADDGTANHFPTGAALAVEELDPISESSNGLLVTFQTPAGLTAGSLYHLVYENIDEAPQTNYFSINNWYRRSPDGPTGERLNPRFPDSDWATLYYTGSTWAVLTGHAPIADLTYASGAHQGMSYGEASYYQAGLADDAAVGRISGTSIVRERFTPTSSMTVIGVGVRVLADNSSVGSLTVSVVRTSDSATLFSRRIPYHILREGPAPTLAVDPSYDDTGFRAWWLRLFVPSPFVLSASTEYALVLSSDDGTFWSWPMRRLVDEYGYHASTAFADGFAEYASDGSTWLPMGRVSEEFDLQFFLATQS